MKRHMEGVPLPGFQEIIRTKVRRIFQPRMEVSTHWSPTKNDIREHRLDLAFRGRVHAWIERNRTHPVDPFSPDDVLPDHLLDVVTRYLSPGEDGRWITYKEYQGDNRSLEKRVREGLKRMWRREHQGPEGIEKLKLDDYTYDLLLKHRIFTLNRLINLSPEDVRKILPSEGAYRHVQEAVHRFNPDWDPHPDYTSPDKPF